MAKKNRFPLLGALAATPVMTASVAQAQTFDVSPSAAIAGIAAVAQAAALKFQLLTLTPGEKLSIAGDRLGGEPSTPAPGLSSGNGRAGRLAPASTDPNHKTKVAKSGPPSGPPTCPNSSGAKPVAAKGIPQLTLGTCPTNRSLQMKRPTVASAATCAPAAGAAKGRATYCSGVASPRVQAGQVDRRLVPTSSAGKCAATPLVKGAGQSKGQVSAPTHSGCPLVKGSGQSKVPTAAATGASCAPK